MVQKNYGAATIWLILALVVIAGGLYFFTKPDAEPAPTPTPEPVAPAPTPEPVPTSIPTTQTINYSSTGFSPSAVTIKVGDTVKFVAAAGTSMWVASAPHPTHTDYPAFDQKSVGAEYSFTFTEEGSYSFHNHRSASHKGTITVTK